MSYELIKILVGAIHELPLLKFNINLGWYTGHYAK
jgi:hypothetical protein